MPDSPAVYIVLIVAIATVIIVMVWRGRGGSFTWRGKKIVVNDAPKPPGEVVVARGMKVTHGAAGNIIGARLDASHLPDQIKVDAASNLEVSHGRVGDITGIDMSGSSTGQKNPGQKKTK